MKTIVSFAVNHDILEKGMYVSRIDGDCITYDIRMKKPNQGDYLSTGGMHSIEHLFATYARNSPIGNQVIYVGPMGCRTGFYLILRDKVSYDRAIDLVKDAILFIKNFNDEMPGGNRQECGNYLDHNIEEAKAVAQNMEVILKEWKVENLQYREEI